MCGLTTSTPRRLRIGLPDTVIRTPKQRIYCRLVLRCFGVRITVSGNPIRNLRGVRVVSPHTSWLDVFVIGAVLPGSFVARADMFSGPATGVSPMGNAACRNCSALSTAST
ncbi:hypothetical protein MAHJHV51_57020 [Mycobacterium avium subsp. hominissuis]